MKGTHRSHSSREMHADTQRASGARPGSRRAATTPASRVLALQATAGNAAVAATLHARSRPAVQRSPDPVGDREVPDLLAIGDQIIRDVKTTISKGAANQRSGLAAHGWEMENIVYGPGGLREPSFRKKPPTDSIELGQDALAATIIKAGNCGEHAALAFCLANERLPRDATIWHVALEMDHAYIVIESAGGTRVAVDPWQDGARARPLETFNFPTSLPGRWTRFRPDGADYRRKAREYVDVEALENRMDSESTPPAPEQIPVGGNSGIYHHVMEPSDDDGDVVMGGT